MKSSDEIARHLERDYTEPVRDPLWNHMYLSPEMMAVVMTPPFQQLSRIRQLGPTHLVYPGATHTRLNHSLGVFHLAKRIIERIIRHPAAPELSIEGVKAFLAAALLHDVGHFPYTHSFKRLPLVEHEELTGRLICEDPLAATIRGRLGVDPSRVAAIVDEGIDSRGDEEVDLYRHLLSGSLDPDKLDYLNRDAYFCGVPYGIQDIDFALSRLVPDGYNGIGLSESGVTAVENILFSKYLMYRAVYWHRTVRVATAMIKKAVYLGLAEGEISPESLYGLDDERFLAGVGERAYRPFELIRRVGHSDLLVPVAERAYDGEDASHRALESMETRLRLEAEVARELSIESHEVILDLPDAISFEASFPIFEDGARLEFAQRSVFSGDVVHRFAANLRRIRLIVPPPVAERTDCASLLDTALAEAPRVSG